MSLKCTNCGHPVAANTQVCRYCGMQKAGEIAAAQNMIIIGAVAAAFVLLYFFPLTILSYIGSDKEFWDIVFYHATSFSSWLLELFLWFVIGGIAFFGYNINNNEKIHKENKKLFNYTSAGIIITIIVFSYYANSTRSKNYKKQEYKQELLNDNYLKERMNSRGASSNNNNMKQENNQKYEEWRQISFQNRRCIIDNLVKEDAEINSIEKLVEKNLSPQSEKVKAILSKC